MIQPCFCKRSSIDQSNVQAAIAETEEQYILIFKTFDKLIKNTYNGVHFSAKL